MLAADSTPDAARDEAMTLADEQGSLTHKEAKEIVDKHKPPSDKPKIIRVALSDDVSAIADKIKEAKDDVFIRALIAALEEG